MKDYWRKNPEKRQRNRRKVIEKLRLEVLTHYGGSPPECVCCGETEIRFLTIDHIEGNGAKHRREIKISGGFGFYYWLKRNNFPEGFQVLCSNCNMAKGKSKVKFCPVHHPELYI